LPATPSSRSSVLTFNIFWERQSSNVGKLQISAYPSCFREDSEEADHALPQQEPVPGPNTSFCAGAQNTCQKCAQVTSDVVGAYFDNFEVTLAGIPPSNIINFDETNLTDDPGQKMFVPKRL